MGALATFCGACPEIFGGSAYLDELNADGEPSPHVKQLSIVTRYDSVVVPYTSGLMRGGGTNVVLQDLCPDDHADHVGLVSDPAVIALIQNALDDKDPPTSCPS
jgi:triacylglycerol lipase